VVFTEIKCTGVCLLINLNNWCSLEVSGPGLTLKLPPKAAPKTLTVGIQWHDGSARWSLESESWHRSIFQSRGDCIQNQLRSLDNQGTFPPFCLRSQVVDRCVRHVYSAFEFLWIGCMFSSFKCAALIISVVQSTMDCGGFNHTQPPCFVVPQVDFQTDSVILSAEPF